MASLREHIFNWKPLLINADEGPNTRESSKSKAGNASSLNLNLDIAINSSLKDLREEWCELECVADLSLYQTYTWVESWVKTQLPRPNSQLVLVSGRHNGELVIILPLLMQKGIINRLDFIGDGHSNFNMAIINPRYLDQMNKTTVSDLMACLVEMMPGIGFIKLCRQPYHWNNVANPLIHLPHQRSTNIAFGLSFAGKFQNTLELINAKRKRKKFRSQMKALKSAQNHRFIEAENTKQVHQLLDAFFKQKADRFESMGMENVFADEEDQNFLRNLAIISLKQKSPPLKLFGLEIDGEIRSVFGGGVHKKHFSGSISSFRNDEWAHISPGELLIYHLMQTLNERGFLSIDMGVGEERYKRSWCPKEIELFDVLLPLSPASKIIVMAGTIWLTTKRYLRTSPYIWPLIRQFRASKSSFRQN